MPNIDDLLEQKKNGTGFVNDKQMDYLKALKTSGRTNVRGADPYGTMVHELGHYLDDTLFFSEMKKAGFDRRDSYSKYAIGISAYATESHQEYIAESFLAFFLGERDNLDPALVDIFEGARNGRR